MKNLSTTSKDNPMKMSDTIAEIATALSKAQGQIDAATKSSLNPHFKSRYADLNSLREAIREPLAVNDLSIVQLPRVDGSNVEVETMLIHKSGEYISEVLRMPYGQNTPQAIGSALSYCRRYSLSSILNLAADDDDGNAATASAAKKKNDQFDSAKEIATQGTAALTEHWKSMSSDARKAFSNEEIAELKKMADAVSKKDDK
jgi:hypothetical protein